VGLLLGEPSKDHCLLTLHFGAAAIGIAVPNVAAQKLGQTLIARVQMIPRLIDHEPRVCDPQAGDGEPAV
jgi:hypothetical protein